MDHQNARISLPSFALQQSQHQHFGGVAVSSWYHGYIFVFPSAAQLCPHLIILNQVIFFLVSQQPILKQ
jgi:hypothetical protein